METPTSLSSIPRPHAINEPQKQSNTFFTFIRKVVSDLRSCCWPTSTHQPTTDPTEYVYEHKQQGEPPFNRLYLSIPTKTEKNETTGKETDTSIMYAKGKIKVNQINSIERENKKLDKPSPDIQTENSVKKAELEVPPNIYDTICSKDIDTVNKGVDELFTTFEEHITEVNIARLSSLTPDIQKTIETEEKSSLVEFAMRRLAGHLKGASPDKDKMVWFLYNPGINENISITDTKCFFSKLKNNELLNVLLKLNNVSSSRITIDSYREIISYAGKNRNKEYLDLIFEYIKSDDLHYFENKENFSLLFPNKSDSCDFIYKTFNENIISMKQGQIKLFTRPEELTDLLQKHNSGEQPIRNADFFNLNVLTHGNPETVKILIRQPEISTLQLMKAQKICLLAQKEGKGLVNQDNATNYLDLIQNNLSATTMLKIIDAELARRAEK